MKKMLEDRWSKTIDDVGRRPAVRNYDFFISWFLTATSSINLRLMVFDQVFQGLQSSSSNHLLHQSKIELWLGEDWSKTSWRKKTMVDPGRDVRRMDSWVSSFFQPSVDHEEKEDRTQDSRPLGLHPSTSRVNGLRPSVFSSTARDIRRRYRFVSSTQQRIG